MSCNACTRKYNYGWDSHVIMVHRITHVECLKDIVEREKIAKAVIRGGNVKCLDHIIYKRLPIPRKAYMMAHYHSKNISMVRAMLRHGVPLYFYQQFDIRRSPELEKWVAGRHPIDSVRKHLPVLMPTVLVEMCTEYML